VFRIDADRPAVACLITRHGTRVGSRIGLRLDPNGRRTGTQICEEAIIAVESGRPPDGFRT
jgi:hypothetical protein